MQAIKSITTTTASMTTISVPGRMCRFDTTFSILDDFQSPENVLLDVGATIALDKVSARINEYLDAE